MMAQRHPKGRVGDRAQHGVSIVVVLLMLVIVALLGVAASRFALQGERSARNDRDREIAFQAAEDALVDAELDIMGPNTAANQRMDMFCPNKAVGFEDGCGTGARNLGLCTTPPAGSPPNWATIDFSSTSGPTVAYGTYTGKTYQTAASGGGGAQPAQLPRYIIEIVPDGGGQLASQARSAAAGQQTYLYQITAVGFGMNPQTQVMLQTVFRKPGKC
jgi:type IV pilus assembly protein PilX